jgi:hypothetical protein
VWPRLQPPPQQTAATVAHPFQLRLCYEDKARALRSLREKAWWGGGESLLRRPQPNHQLGRLQPSRSPWQTWHRATANLLPRSLFLSPCVYVYVYVYVYVLLGWLRSKPATVERREESKIWKEQRKEGRKEGGAGAAEGQGGGGVGIWPATSMADRVIAP